MKFASKLACTAAAIGMLGVAAPAFAQDRSTHFDGPYISGAVGMSGQNNDVDNALQFDTNRDGTFQDVVRNGAGANAFSTGFCNGAANGATAAAGCRNDDDDIDYAVRVGYDKRFTDNIVGGVLIEVSRNESTDSTTGFSTTPASYTITRSTDYVLAARSRLGFTPGGGALFYGTGGFTYSRLKHDFSTTNTANSFTENNDDKMVWGWQAGGGAEVMLTDNISLGAEYLYSRFYDKHYTVAVGPGTAAPTNPFLLVSGGTNLRNSDQNFNLHSMRATLSLQF